MTNHIYDTKLHLFQSGQITHCVTDNLHMHYIDYDLDDKW